MSQVSVTINGRVYRMACDDGQEAIIGGSRASSTCVFSNCARPSGESAIPGRG